MIEEGRYGAVIGGTGPYRHLARDAAGGEISMTEALARGRVEIRLDGQKLRGGGALVRTRRGGQKANWPLIKMKDEFADARRRPTKTEPRSVLSGRTVEEVAQA